MVFVRYLALDPVRLLEFAFLPYRSLFFCRLGRPTEGFLKTVVVALKETNFRRTSIGLAIRSMQFLVESSDHCGNSENFLFTRDHFFGFFLFLSKDFSFVLPSNI